jgi:hypothetical protein
VDEKTLHGFMMTLRQALLMIVDAIEEYLDMSPKTAELRRDAKRK